MTDEAIRTRNQHNIIIYRCVSIGQKTVHDIGARLWNGLTTEYKGIESKNVFQKRVRNKYIAAYSDDA